MESFHFPSQGKCIVTHFLWLSINLLKHMFLVFCRHTWQVQDKIDANNVAYTTGKLSFHTDYPALHHPPGVRWASSHFPQARPRENVLLDCLDYITHHWICLTYIFFSEKQSELTNISCLSPEHPHVLKGKGYFHSSFWKSVLYFFLEIIIGALLLCQDRSWDVSVHISLPLELKENELWKHSVTSHAHHLYQQMN